MRRLLPLLLCAVAACHPAAAPQPAVLPWQDLRLPFATRAADLVGRMTPAERVGQMGNTAPAIARLGVPAYNWWNEGLHGVARNGIATVFPQAIGLAATWDTLAMHRVATVIGVEARAKYAAAQAAGQHGTYQGLTFWSPNINIFRDPRWGRGMETYGEDPWLTGRLAVAFVRGLQGSDPRYLQAIATPKHFAVHSGPEPTRHAFDASIGDRDLLETYLPAFEAAIREGGARSVMCAYNRLDGTPACANSRLLGDILRGQWGFTGYVVTDCDAIDDMVHGHHSDSTIAAAAAHAVMAGTDLNCGNSFRRLALAASDSAAVERAVDTAVTRLFTARMELGLFDPAARVRYARIPADSNNTPDHAALALKMAEESMVLLRNDGILPLDRHALHRVAVVGPNADNVEILLGNYNGTPSAPVTPLAGIRAALGPDVQVTYARGSAVARSNASDSAAADSAMRAEAVTSARNADIALIFAGLSPRLEGEEMKVDAPGFQGGDRTSLDLPAPQEQLIEAVAATGKPIVLILLNGSALAVNWPAAHVNAILEAWYPGEAAGTAIAATLLGDVNPAGRLPVTFYHTVDDLPPFTNYDMAGRTYRYFTGDVLYPFGFGLSYTHFHYDHLHVPATVRTGETITVSADVANTGARPGDEVVELYLTDRSATVPVPVRTLAGFARVSLRAGERRTVRFVIRPRQRSVVSDSGTWQEHPGAFDVSVGGEQPGQHGSALAATTDVVTGGFVVRP